MRDVQAEMVQRQANLVRAKELRDQGLSYKKIGKELAVHESTARGYILDPDRKKELSGRPRWGEIQVLELSREPIWMKQKGETVKAYSAFSIYRDMDATERSYKKAALKSKKHESRCTDWSKKYRWQERVRAWDAHVEEISIQAQERAIVEMNERHAGMAMEGLRLVIQRLKGDPDAGVPAINPALFSAADIARLSEVLTKQERLARGSETERVDNQHRPIEIRLVPGLMTQDIREPSMGESLPELPPAA